MTKIAAVTAGVLLLAGAALAGTVTSLGSAGSPRIGSTVPTASVTVRHEGEHNHRSGRPDDRGHHRRHRGHDRHGGRDD
jgi:hypothetical protein